jgi:hypothetical protein
MGEECVVRNKGRQKAQRARREMRGHILKEELAKMLALRTVGFGGGGGGVIEAERAL